MHALSAEVGWPRDLGDHFVPVRDEDPDSTLDLTEIGAQVVLEILDPDPLDSFHGAIVATGSHFVKAEARPAFPRPRQVDVIDGHLSNVRENPGNRPLFRHRSEAGQGSYFWAATVADSSLIERTTPPRTT